MGLYPQGTPCGTEYYQMADKVIDVIITALMFWYLKTNGLLSDTEYNTITYLFVYRIIGVLLFLRTKDRRYLIYFPNICLELALLFSVLRHYDLPYHPAYFVGVLAFKIAQEIHLHGQ